MGVKVLDSKLAVSELVRAEEIVVDCLQHQSHRLYLEVRLVLLESVEGVESGARDC